MNDLFVFGEILFDCLPDGREILGGAPFNVAWNLSALGGTPLLVSRVGDDERGLSVLEAMQQWGMETSLIQKDSVYPTGTARIELANGLPSFDLRPEQAYDYIAVSSVIAHPSPSILYYGTLALRNEVSRASLEILRASENVSCFVDLNLREPWWNRDDFGFYLSGARWLKINDEELTIVSGVQLQTLEEQVTAAGRLCERYGLEQVIVTRGGAGAFVATATGLLAKQDSGVVATIVDTVGAGDAFASVFLLGLLKKWEMRATLSRAAEFAAGVCELAGATTNLRTFYEDYSQRWSV